MNDKIIRGRCCVRRRRGRRGRGHRSGWSTTGGDRVTNLSYRDRDQQKAVLLVASSLETSGLDGQLSSTVAVYDPNKDPRTR